MSDDDWGDDAGGDDGWGDDGGGGGDDDGWGEKLDDDDDFGGGGGDDDGWGDGGDDDDDEAMDGKPKKKKKAIDVNMQIANLFYDADDDKRDNPVEALTKFQQVVDLGTTTTTPAAADDDDAVAALKSQTLNAESQTCMFQSRVHMVVLHYELGHTEEMLSLYKTVLTLIPTVTRNEGADAIDRVLAAVDRGRPHGMDNDDDDDDAQAARARKQQQSAMLEQVYTVTGECLATLPDSQRMVFDVKLKLCRTYVTNGDAVAALRTLDQLHDTCRVPDSNSGSGNGSGNGSGSGSGSGKRDDAAHKGTELIEIYALRARLALTQWTTEDDAADAAAEAAAVGGGSISGSRSGSKQAAVENANAAGDVRDVTRRAWLKRFYLDTKDLQAAVSNARSQSVIRECWGKHWAGERQWNRAYGDFYSSFTMYQEVGDRPHAKACLQYVVVANMLTDDASHNPFDAREAKVYQHDADIAAFGSLTLAHTNCDVRLFSTALKTITTQSDAFVRRHLAAMVTDFHRRATLQLIRPYTRVRIQHLADMLVVKMSAMTDIVVQLILDERVCGAIDQATMTLTVTSSASSSASATATATAPVSMATRHHAQLQQWATTLHSLSTVLPLPYAGMGV